IALSVNLFVVHFFSKEQYIYFWDLAVYWDEYQTFGDIFWHKPLAALKVLFHSMRHADYNDLPVLWLMPFHRCFGDTRLAYTLAVVNVYALPAILLFVPVFRSMSQTSWGTWVVSVLIPLTTAALLPQVLNPVLYGYLDVVGVVVINAILILYLHQPL